MLPFSSGFSEAVTTRNRRQENGCFKNIEDLRQVVRPRGHIGQRTRVRSHRGQVVGGLVNTAPYQVIDGDW
jgi:hypothetical protein